MNIAIITEDGTFVVRVDCSTASLLMRLAGRSRGVL